MSMPDAVDLKPANESKILPFLWIGLYSSFLTVITLTLFRFWARTIVRKRLWSETTIGGEPLEYTGKGSELFVGFLIAIVTVMAPLVGALVAAQLLLDTLTAALVIAAVYLVFFLLVGVAIFLARRYQLSRTLWRGVRFEQRGSALAYGLATFGYGLLTIITLGWFGPAARLRLEKRLWNNTYFGDMAFAYDNSREARTEPVYLSYILAFVGIIGFYVAFGLAFYALYRDGLGVPGVTDLLRLYGILFGAGLLLVFFVAWHEAAMLRQITKSLSIASVSLRLRFSAWDIIQLAITNALLVIFTFGIGLLAAQMRVWRKVVQRLEISGDIDLAAIHQAATRGPRSGEGMADAFDLSGGV
jgi:uncharacterized membrane protein YjgN (DUF898 family)